MGGNSKNAVLCVGSTAADVWCLTHEKDSGNVTSIRTEGFILRLFIILQKQDRNEAMC